MFERKILRRIPEPCVGFGHCAIVVGWEIRHNGESTRNSAQRSDIIAEIVKETQMLVAHGENRAVLVRNIQPGKNHR